MMQVNINKITFSVVLCLLFQLSFLCNEVIANNTSYITLSNQIARQRQLDMVANNAANTNTIGYEQDDMIFRKVDYKQNSIKKNDSMVFAETTFKTGGQGGLKVTNNPLDLAVLGRGYFKIITPRGPRYTLDGSFIINRQNIIVNMQGYPVANVNSVPIEIPETPEYIQITEDGTIFVDDEEVDEIGVFDFADKDPLIKEGNNLYKASSDEIVLEDYSVVSGALRESNVKQALVMSKLVELQRSVGATGSLMMDINELEKSAISKLPSR